MKKEENEAPKRIQVRNKNPKWYETWRKSTSEKKNVQLLTSLCSLEFLSFRTTRSNCLPVILFFSLHLQYLFKIRDPELFLRGWSKLSKWTTRNKLLNRLRKDSLRSLALRTSVDPATLSSVFCFVFFESRHPRQWRYWVSCQSLRMHLLGQFQSSNFLRQNTF